MGREGGCHPGHWDPRLWPVLPPDRTLAGSQPAQHDPDSAGRVYLRISQPWGGFFQAQSNLDKAGPAVNGREVLAEAVRWAGLPAALGSGELGLPWSRVLPRRCSSEWGPWGSSSQTGPRPTRLRFQTALSLIHI